MYYFSFLDANENKIGLDSNTVYNLIIEKSDDYTS